MLHRHSAAATEGARCCQRLHCRLATWLLHVAVPTVDAKRTNDIAGAIEVHRWCDSYNGSHCHRAGAALAHAAKALSRPAHEVAVSNIKAANAAMHSAWADAWSEGEDEVCCSGCSTLRMEHGGPDVGSTSTDMVHGKVGSEAKNATAAEMVAQDRGKGLQPAFVEADSFQEEGEADQAAEVQVERKAAVGGSGVEWSGVEWSGGEWSGVEWGGVEWNGME